MFECSGVLSVTSISVSLEGRMDSVTDRRIERGGMLETVCLMLSRW